MSTPDGSLGLPRVYCEDELWRCVGGIHVRTDAVADRLANYGLTPQQIGATTVYLSAEDEPEGLDVATGYDAATATLTLYPMTTGKPPGTQASHPRRDRRVPTGSRPEKYFEDRSNELSGLLAGMLVHRAVDAGYRTEGMRRKQDGHSLWRGALYTGATALSIYGYYRADEAGITEPTAGFIMTIGAIVTIGVVAAWAGSESRRQEKEERDTVAARYALEAYHNAPSDLVRITPRYNR